MTGLFERRRFTANVNPAGTSGWYLKSVLFDGQDITDSGAEFAPGRSYDGAAGGAHAEDDRLSRAW